MNETPDSVRAFWFGSSADDAAVAQQYSKLWWAKNDEVDAEMRVRFDVPVKAAMRRELDDWAKTPTGLLALILLSDQFPRNVYRATPASFQADDVARGFCLQGLEQGFDRQLRPIERVFLYMPLEHSESHAHQARAVDLFTQLFQAVPADQIELFRGFLTFALRHRRVIERFGRFPHRNAILGRPSTPEEIAFLQEPGSSF